MTTVERFEKNIDQVNSDFQAIKSKIVECGVEVANGTKTAELAEKVGEVFEAGKKSEYDEFWDIVQNSGKRINYNSAFSDWAAEFIRPKYKVVPTGANSAGSTFYACPYLKKVEAAYFDFSQKPTGTNTNTGYSYTFSGCSKLEEVEDVGLIPQTGYYNTFAYCYKLHTIAKIGVNEDTKFSNAFISCDKLENLAIDGTIGQNGFNIKWSTNLSKASILSVLNALSPTASGLTVTLSLAAVNKAFETSEGANDGSDSQEFLVWTEEGPEYGYRNNWTIALA